MKIKNFFSKLIPIIIISAFVLTPFVGLRAADKSKSMVDDLAEYGGAAVTTLSFAGPANFIGMAALGPGGLLIGAGLLTLGVILDGDLFGFGNDKPKNPKEAIEKCLKRTTDQQELDGINYSSKKYGLSNDQTVAAICNSTEAGNLKEGADASSGANQTPSEDFLWKPVSESDGKLVVLLPTSFRGTVSATAVQKDNQTIEVGMFSGDSQNGLRPHFRFTKPGAQYGTNIQLTAADSSGKMCSWEIANGAVRVEGTEPNCNNELSNEDAEVMSQIEEQLNANVNNSESESNDVSIVVEPYDNKSQIITVDKKDETKNVTIYIANVESKTAGNTIEEINTVINTLSPSNIKVSDFVKYVYLYIDGVKMARKTPDKDSSNGTFTFSNIDLELGDNEELSLEIKADFKEQDGEYPERGLKAYVRSIEVDYRDSDGELKELTNNTAGGIFELQLDSSATNTNGTDLSISCEVSDTSIEVGEETEISIDISGGESPYKIRWSGDTSRIKKISKTKNNQDIEFEKAGRYVLEVKVTDDKDEEVEEICSAITVREKGAKEEVEINNSTVVNSNQSSSGSSNYPFYRDLTVGSEGADVSALQDFLISNGYLVMPAGVAKGYFGNVTRDAVIKWQISRGISPAAGYFGAKSRAALSGSAVVISSVSTASQNTNNVNYLGICSTTNQTAALGESGQMVTDIQSFLVSKGFLVMPENTSYGYFGKLTATAIANYMATKGVSTNGSYIDQKLLSEVKRDSNCR